MIKQNGYDRDSSDAIEVIAAACGGYVAYGANLRSSRRLKSSLRA